MAPRGRRGERELKPGFTTGLFSAGAVVMVVVCCGGHLLVLGLLGGVALGSMLGIGAGALAAVLLVVGSLALRRRREEPARAVPPVARVSR